VDATAFREHIIYKTYLVELTVTGISLEILSQDEFYFGVLESSEFPPHRKETPPFK
jgi:hypothetical protein